MAIFFSFASPKITTHLLGVRTKNMLKNKIKRGKIKILLSLCIWKFPPFSFVGAEGG